MPTSVMRFSGFVALVALLTSLAAIGPASAGGDASVPADVLRAEDLESFGTISLADVRAADPLMALEGLGFTEVEQRLTGTLLRGVSDENYAFGDDRSTPPVLDAPAARPVGMANVQVNLDNFVPPTEGMTPSHGYFVSTGDISGDFTLVVVQTEGPFDADDGIAINEGAVFNRPSIPPWMSDFEGDTWEGGNLFPTVTYSPQPFQLQMTEFVPPQNFIPNPNFDGFAFRQDDVLVVGVATDDLTRNDPLSDITMRSHIHHSLQPSSPGSVHRGEFMPALENEPIPVGTFLTIAPEPEPEPTPEPEPEPEVDPNAGVSETPVTPDPPAVIEDEPADTVGDGTNTSDGSFRTWISLGVIVIGGMAIALGYWQYQRTRTRDEEDETTPLHSTPPPVVPDTAKCDWELHYLQPTGWEVLRKAEAGHKACCVYKVSVITTINEHDQAASFRQDVAPERTYIPDFNFQTSALNFSSNASTRSGPAGEQDWQHGLGDTENQAAFAPDKPYVQTAQGEERPELATHLSRDESTSIQIDLESQCASPVSVYKSSGETEIRMLATQECTNDDPAEGCPIELNAFGSHEGEVVGDAGVWLVGHAIGTDIDELEGNSNPPLWDSHDHESRDRLTYEHSDSARGATESRSFNWETRIQSRSTLDAAQLVPQHTWPTTERVSTHIEQGVRHVLDLAGEMTKGDCAATGCCTGDPNHVCNCTPSFTMSLDGGSSVLNVDGKSYELARDLPSDRTDPPTGFPETDTWQATAL